MLTLNDGRSELWQWDTGRKLTVDADCSQVHFSNKVFGRSIDVDVVDGVAIIPDVLLQTDKDLNAWAFVGTPENGYTKISKIFKVNKRNKPADYVFTPTDQTTLGEILDRIEDLEKRPSGGNGGITKEVDPTVPDWAKQPTKPSYTASEVGALPADTVIPTIPDNVSAFRNDAGYLTEHQDLTGYATEQYVQGYAQPKGNYLTEVPAGYAKTEDVPTKPEDIGAQPKGEYLTAVPDGYATEEYVKNKIAEAELGGEEVDLSGYAKISDLPTKTSQLTNDSGFITKAPVESVNGKAGSVNLSASDVGARPDTWMPTAQDVGALPNTYVPPTQTAEQVGADPTGTAAKAVSEHNTDTAAHNDLRLEVKAINDRLTAFFDSDDQTLDELSEIVAYITSNKTLIDSITTNKVSVADIVNNLTTNAANKPLSAAQGVVLKGLIDGLSTGKLDANKLQEAINTALAQAKTSGEFDGKDGVSATHKWSGTTLTITSASGTSSADLKGDKGDKGEQGIQGIQGPQGEPGAKGDKGDTGETGPAGPAGKDGQAGSPGKDGSNGVSATHSWNGTVLTVTSSSGTSSADLKGEKGNQGNPGKTAYQYAKDGGYAGSEADFAEKLANEYSLNPLYGKKVSFLGDSICAGSSESTSYLGGYGKIIADRNGMVYENVAHAGATVTAETYSRTTGNAKPWLCRMVENMRADADYAIIEGGLNDGWDETVRGKVGAITTGYDADLDDTTYYGAFESMLKQLVTKFQGKKIGYIAVPKIHSLYDSSQNAPNFYHIALECCAKWGVSVCDLNTITPPVEYLADLGTDYTADACHPTYEGYLKYYCDPIEAWMKTLITSGGNNNASVSPEVVSDINSKITALETGKLSNTGVYFRKALLPLADGTTLEIDVLTAVDGTLVIKYVNRVPISIDTDGSVYNGTGFKINTRLSSSGAAKSQDGCVATGFIPAVGGDTIYLGGDYPWYISTANNNYLCAYDSNFNFIGAVYNTVSDMYYNKHIAAGYELGDVCKITLINDANIAYIRASWGLNWNNDGSGIIVTVNQEITE